MIMSLIGMLVLGLICGAIARLIMPGKENLSWLMTAVLGVIGSFVGGTLGSLIFEQSLKFKTASHAFIGGVIGSLIVLFIYNKFVAKKATGLNA